MKLQLLAAQSKKPTPVANEQLDSLRSELTRLAIDRSEQQARLEYLEKMRAEVQERIANRAGLDRDIKRIDEQLPAATTALRRAEARVRELENTKASFKPIDLTKSDSYADR
jgi:predicted RNase H-like nuclease (RuvC/YqgF family)